MVSAPGCGSTQPNPSQQKVMPGGVKVPLGTPASASLPQPTSLLYNEYIVYDVSQIKVR